MMRTVGMLAAAGAGLYLLERERDDSTIKGRHAPRAHAPLRAFAFDPAGGGDEPDRTWIAGVATLPYWADGAPKDYASAWALMRLYGERRYGKAAGATCTSTWCLRWPGVVTRPDAPAGYARAAVREWLALVGRLRDEVRRDPSVVDGGPSSAWATDVPRLERELRAILATLEPLPAAAELGQVGDHAWARMRELSTRLASSVHLLGDADAEARGELRDTITDPGAYLRVVTGAAGKVASATAKVAGNAAADAAFSSAGSIALIGLAVYLVTKKGML